MALLDDGHHGDVSQLSSLFLKTHGTAVSCYTGEGGTETTNKQDEDQTRPATHSPKLLRDKGHRGTKDTEGQRTLRDNGH